MTDFCLIPLLELPKPFNRKSHPYLEIFRRSAPASEFGFPFHWVKRTVAWKAGGHAISRDCDPFNFLVIVANKHEPSAVLVR